MAGLPIQEGRGNAVKMCTAVLSQVLEQIPGTCVLSIPGGTAVNAIPREATAVVAVSALESSHYSLRFLAEAAAG